MEVPLIAGADPEEISDRRTTNGKPEANRRGQHHSTRVPLSNTTSDTKSPNDKARGRRYPRKNSPSRLGEAKSPNISDVVTSASTHNKRPQQPAYRRGDHHQGREASSTTSTITSANDNKSSTDNRNPSGKGNRRGPKFNAGLTERDPISSTDAALASGILPQGKYKGKGKARGPNPPLADDLTSTLSHALRTPPYPDCPICFSSIHPAQPTWSCSPSIPVILSNDSDPPQYCWTTFHIKCIKSWAAKSVKEVADAWRARGEEGKHGDWRCPGCQSKREVVPSGYWCFCNSTPEPKLTRLSTPHSCGSPCSRRRETGCGHPCPLQCHPGPCPSCQVTTRLECYCPRKKIIAFRCGLDQKHGKIQAKNVSCGEVCGRLLGCGKHICTKVCHDGDCGTCQVREVVRCWCGKEKKEVDCGEGEREECFVEGEEPWIGRYGCGSQCDRLFDCGSHKCEKSCHPPSHVPALCPRSPSKVTHCPCGNKTIAPLLSSEISQYDFPARSHCTSRVPTCASVCSKPHLSCSHPCTDKCHTGACPPCTVEIVRPCRCGASTRKIRCYEIHQDSRSEAKELLCDKPCTVLRACGMHQCRRICCPLASLTTNTNKKLRNKKLVDDGPGLGEERGGLHECDLVCGKILSCGNHQCEEKDHRGACPPCLRSSFEELICSCGQTVLEPPIPCGAQIQCNYPCPRPPMNCGHPQTPHSCHSDSIPCPPCPFLASKECACGKKVMPYVRCSLETAKISCGTVCGKVMSCGFHPCDRLCHAGDCGPCTAPCGKPRRLCLPNQHPCIQPCHAPSSCDEIQPCQSLINLTCPCGRNRQATHCGVSISNPNGKQATGPKCTNECNIAKRNARLAEALGITPDSKEKAETAFYKDELAAFARANPKFLTLVEKTFSDFISSAKRSLTLPHMPVEKRKFVHDLAAVYRLDAQMVDQEPYRSVQLMSRVDTRLPSPLLSTSLTSNLGKLADFRSLKAPVPQASSWRSTATPSSKPVGDQWTPSNNATRVGWGSVISRPTSTDVPATKTSTTNSNTTAIMRGSSSRPHNTRRLQVDENERTAAISLDEPVTDNWEDDV